MSRSTKAGECVFRRSQGLRGFHTVGPLMDDQARMRGVMRQRGFHIANTLIGA
jgi:hypothetical protein